MESEDDTNMSRIKPLVTVYRQAIQTFISKSDGSGNFVANFINLKESLDKIRAADVGFDKVFESERIWESGEKAPCTYIEIFENEIMNMSIFILKPGFKMPLHDHPQMHGLLKVISGTVGIRTYSEIKGSNDNELNIATEDQKSRMLGNSILKSVIAQVTEQKICNAESEACMLSPEVSNFHEIEAIGGPSAFLDILAPPYSVDLNFNEPRECRYYQEVREIGDKKVHLQEIAAPAWFYCDQAPYLGPHLSLIDH